MKKVIKIIFIILVAIIISYSLLIVAEVHRFNNTPSRKPLIVIKIDTEIKQGQETYSESYTGLGYKVKYECRKEEKSTDNHVVIVLSGDFYLFGKIRLSSWIQ